MTTGAGIGVAAGGRGWRVWAQGLGLALLLLIALPFALYSAEFGLRGFARDLSGETYLYRAGAWASNGALFLHMLGGAAITILAPLQLIGPIRRRAPRLHRALGWTVAPAAVATALGGLTFIGLRGTVGGPHMDAGFALYGGLTLLAGAQTWRLALAQDFAAHRRWALRLIVLALGSWLYRLHYGLWHAATGGLWSAPDFSGAFDKVQLVAFYLPYLAALELWLRREGLKKSERISA